MNVYTIFRLHMHGNHLLIDFTYKYGYERIKAGTSMYRSPYTNDSWGIIMFRLKNIIIVVIRYLILAFWSFYEFVTLNNYLSALVYEEVFPNGYTESEKLRVDTISNVINKLYYVILILVIAYLLILIINYWKDKDLKYSLINIGLLALIFAVVVFAKYFVCHCYMLDELLHLRLYGGCAAIAVIILLGSKFVKSKRIK